MNYDFSGLSADQLSTMEKKLQSLKKSFFKEYNLIFNAINNKNFQDSRMEILTILDDKFNDQINKSLAGFSKTMTDANDSIQQYL